MSGSMYVYLVQHRIVTLTSIKSFHSPQLGIVSDRIEALADLRDAAQVALGEVRQNAEQHLIGQLILQILRHIAHVYTLGQRPGNGLVLVKTLWMFVQSTSHQTAYFCRKFGRNVIINNLRSGSLPGG